MTMDSRNGSAVPAAPTGGPQEPEVRARATRRSFTKDYKARILREADAARSTPGAVGALLRREGLYSSHLVEWRAQLARGGEARHFFQSLAARGNVDPANLVLHADNGAPMRGRALADLLESLGVERSHSRPRTSNDNAFSEAQFKTMKYRPTYPRRFESEADARAWCREFFRWYNHEHRHEGLALLTPADVHLGRAEERLALSAETLAAACEQHPERFVKGTPTPKRPPATVAINPQPPREESMAGATSIPQAAEVTKWRQPVSQIVDRFRNAPTREGAYDRARQLAEDHGLTIHF